MSIAVGQIGSGTVVSGSETTSVTTTGVATSASGSSFYVGVICRLPGDSTIATGTIAGTVLTVAGGVTGNALTVGQYIQGTNVSAGTKISSFGTGAGGNGTYNLNLSSTVSVGESMTGYTIPGLTVTDSKSNTYSQISTTQVQITSPPFILARFYTTNGTGGASHTATATASGGLTEAWTCWLVEMTGAATSSLLDQSNAQTGFGAQPWNSGNITITPPAGSEMMIGLLTESEFPGTTISVGGSFTLQAQFSNNNFGNAPVGAIATQVTAANGTYSASFTTSNGGSNSFTASVDSFLGASGPPPGIVGKLFVIP
jgi:hypothetical protein